MKWMVQLVTLTVVSTLLPSTIVNKPTGLDIPEDEHSFSLCSFFEHSTDKLFT